MFLIRLAPRIWGLWTPPHTDIFCPSPGQAETGICPVSCQPCWCLDLRHAGWQNNWFMTPLTIVMTGTSLMTDGRKAATTTHKIIVIMTVHVLGVK